jgi:hypothetical protein
MTRTRALALVVLIAGLAGALQHDDHTAEDARHRSTTPPSSTTPLARAARPRPVTNALVRAQDRPSLHQRQHEAAALQHRRLLDHLPLQLAGVRIEVAGLSADGRRTALLVRAGRHSRRFARTAYRQALHTFDDSGRAYELRWTR